MTLDASIEQRLAAVERALADIQQRLGTGSVPTNWIERFTGAFKDEPAFAEVVEYGRQFRAAQQLPEDFEP